MVNLDDKFKNIKLLAMDFDGVMTVGAYVWTDQDGKESVQCSRKDGLGIELLKKHGLDAIVISKETNPVVTARCQKLKLECAQTVETGQGKLEILREVAKRRGIALEAIAYMGDDLQDIPVLKAVGLPIAVADAHVAVKAVCKYTTEAEGGRGAIREVCEKILEAKGIEIKWD